MAQLNSNGIATHTMDLSELPFGNFVVRGTYPENQYYKGSTGTAVIHHYPTNEDERTCHEAGHFCEYTPSTCERGEAGENITEDQLCAVADNQFIVADMKNSTSMEVLIGILEGQQTELENTRIYLLHGSTVQVYCEKDATDGYLHIHYTHPTNPAYANINVATTLDFTDANKFTFTIDDGGCCTLRVWNQNSNGDGTWSTTLDYTYTFPSEYVLEPLDVWDTSTGVSTTSRVLVEGIDYEYTYTPHIAVDCKQSLGFKRLNGHEIAELEFDNYGFITSKNTSTTNNFFCYYDFPLGPSMKIEATLQNRDTQDMFAWIGLRDTSIPQHNVTNSSMNFNGVAVSQYPNTSYVVKNTRFHEKHGENTSTYTNLSTPIIHDAVKVVFEITYDGHIRFSDNLGHSITSTDTFTREELGNMRLSWKGEHAKSIINTILSITSLRIYNEYTP